MVGGDKVKQGDFLIIYFFQAIKRLCSPLSKDGFVMIELMMALVIFMMSFKAICCLERTLTRNQHKIILLLKKDNPTLQANQRQVAAISTKSYIKIISAHQIPAWCSRGVVVDEETFLAQAS